MNAVLRGETFVPEGYDQDRAGGRCGRLTDKEAEVLALVKRTRPPHKLRKSFT